MPISLLAVLGFCGLVVAVVGLVLSLGDFGFVLANRLPHKRLALYSLNESRAVLICGLVFILLLILVGNSVGGFAIELLGGGLVLFAIISYIFTLVLVSRFCIHLRRIVKQAFAQ